MERPPGHEPEQIAEDLAGLAGSGVDHVFFSSIRARDIDEELELDAAARS